MVHFQNIHYANKTTGIFTYGRFGVRDLVKVVDEGFGYTQYRTAFKYFWGEPKMPEGSMEVRYNPNKIWHICGVAYHSNRRTILYWISDGKHNLVYGVGAFKLVMQRSHPIKKHVRYIDVIGG